MIQLQPADSAGQPFHSGVDAVAIGGRAAQPNYPASVFPLPAANDGIRIPGDPTIAWLPGIDHEGFAWSGAGSHVGDDQRNLGLVIKRLIDIAGASFGLVALAPLFLAIALALRLREGSTILFRQTRVGLDGRPFTIFKFRTMVTDAEALLVSVAHLNMRDGPLFKAINDPRVTSIGAFLRRSSLDELPQLWNVLRGEMSLVGPRPPLPNEVAAYEGWHYRRLSVKPGITGLWQIEARQEPGFDRLVECDLSYIDRWSLRLDLKILLLTIPAVFVGTGE
jgi:lipopolysaccharide/colanic/teichoic acid biosynthesis glycosyltransferase